MELPMSANGVILYEGPSLLDGAPIVVIATGIKNVSTNAKTGEMIQTYILRSDMTPIDAVHDGADESICGACPHRGDGTGHDRSCYVTLFHGPRAVYAAYKRGAYPAMSIRDVNFVLPFQNRMVRLGTYGDPVAVPYEIWRIALQGTKGHTGYTHQWRRPDVDPAVWAPLVMASADSVADMDDAHALGYRTFRVTPVGDLPIKGREIVCPASHEAGQKVECIDCKACMGTSAKARVSIQIQAHGTGKKYV